MSSGTFEYTLEERATLLDQFADVMEAARERKRPAKAISRVLQAAISDDDIIVVPKVTVTPEGKVFHVTGNFVSAKEAIEAGNYPLKWGMAEDPPYIPLIIQPVDCKAKAVPLGRMIKTGQMFDHFPRLVDPMTLFAFGAKFPEE